MRKLSEIKGDEAIDVIAAIAEPILNIALDEGAADFFKREKAPEGVDQARYTMERWRSSVPKLMGGHKDDLVAILASVNGVEPGEYRESMTMASLLADVYGILTDEELLAFLS